MQRRATVEPQEAPDRQFDGPSEAPTADVFGFDLCDMVGHLVRVAQQIHAALWAERVPDHLTSQQFALLHELAREEPLDQRTLGARTFLDRSTVTDIVARLANKGLIRQTRDPTDGRKRLVKLTDAGRVMQQHAVGPAYEVNTVLLSGLEDHDRSSLVNLLTALVDRHRSVLDHQER